jgi:hypothetical protein
VGATTVTPWITSATLSLAGQGAVTLTNSSFTYALPAMSVSTFVGQGSNTAPGFASLPDRTVHAGTTLVLTNTAHDPDVPPQSLSYQLLQGPTNATLDGATGVLVWRSAVTQANTTNLFVVTVTDNGAPPLSDTNTFSLVVAPLNRPMLSPALGAAGQLTLTLTGDTGPDVTLLTSTNLSGWQALFTTNSPALPLTLTLTNQVGPQRFYRIQLGP